MLENLRRIDWNLNHDFDLKFTKILLKSASNNIIAFEIILK